MVFIFLNLLEWGELDCDHGAGVGGEQWHGQGGGEWESQCGHPGGGGVLLRLWMESRKMHCKERHTLKDDRIQLFRFRAMTNPSLSNDLFGLKSHHIVFLSLIYIWLGLQAMSSHPAHPDSGAGPDGADHPLCLRLGDQATADGGGAEEYEECHHGWTGGHTDTMIVNI